MDADQKIFEFALAEKQVRARLGDLLAAVDMLGRGDSMRMLARYVFDESQYGLGRKPTTAREILAHVLGVRCCPSKLYELLASSRAILGGRSVDDRGRDTGQVLAVNWNTVYSLLGRPVPEYLRSIRQSGVAGVGVARPQVILSPQTGQCPQEGGERSAGGFPDSGDRPPDSGDRPPDSGKRAMGCALHARPRTDFDLTLNFDDVDVVKVRVKFEKAYRLLWPSRARLAFREVEFLWSILVMAESPPYSQDWLDDGLRITAKRATRNTLGFLRTTLTNRLWEYLCVCTRDEAPVHFAEGLAAVRATARRHIAETQILKWIGSRSAPVVYREPAPTGIRPSGDLGRLVEKVGRRLQSQIPNPKS